MQQPQSMVDRANGVQFAHAHGQHQPIGVGPGGPDVQAAPALLIDVSVRWRTGGAR